MADDRNLNERELTGDDALRFAREAGMEEASRGNLFYACVGDLIRFARLVRAGWEPSRVVKEPRTIEFTQQDGSEPVKGVALARSVPETLPERGNTVCNPHPDAPHGFNRSRSLNEDRYVCDCEGWMPPGVLGTFDQQELDAARLRGEQIAADLAKAIERGGEPTDDEIKALAKKHGAFDADDSRGLILWGNMPECGIVGFARALLAQHARGVGIPPDGDKAWRQWGKEFAERPWPDGWDGRDKAAFQQAVDGVEGRKP